MGVAMESHGICGDTDEWLKKKLVCVMPKFLDYIGSLDFGGMMKQWTKYYTYSRNYFIMLNNLNLIRD
jgi:hypothetical protein